MSRASETAGGREDPTDSQSDRRTDRPANRRLNYATCLTTIKTARRRVWRGSAGRSVADTWANTRPLWAHLFTLTFNYVRVRVRHRHAASAGRAALTMRRRAATAAAAP